MSLQNAPQTLDTASRLKLALSITVRLLVDNPVLIEQLALIVAPPEVSVDLSSLNNIISDQLRAGLNVAGTHYVRADVSGPALVEAKDPHVALLAAFGMMGEGRLINLYGSPVVTELVPTVVILEVLMDQLPHFLVDFVDI